MYGLPENPKEQIVTETITALNTSLKLNLVANDFNNIFRIGKPFNGKPRPILVQFISYLRKQTIYKNIVNLKAAGMSIANDLVPEEIEIRRKLVTHLQQARERNLLAKIKGNRLEVNGDLYTLDELNSGYLQNLESFTPTSTTGVQLPNNNQLDVIPEGLSPTLLSQTSLK